MAVKNKKGIVLSPPFKSLGGGEVRCGGDPDPLELRKYLLYWDEIDYPSNNVIHVTSGNIEYLLQAGVLKRTRINFSSYSGGQGGEMFLLAQEMAFRQNAEREPGVWSIAQLSDTAYYSQQESGLTVDIELYSLLPVPSVNTPFEDILEFKNRRLDELMGFRLYLDDVYQKVISSADIPRSKNSELAKLESSLHDLDRVLNESAISLAYTSLRSTIVAGLGGWAFSGVGIPSLIPFSPVMVGVTCAGVAMAYKFLGVPSSRSYPQHMNYLASFRRNFNSE